MEVEYAAHGHERRQLLVLGHVADAADIGVTVLLREAEALAEVRADHVARPGAARAVGRR